MIRLITCIIFALCLMGSSCNGGGGGPTPPPPEPPLTDIKIGIAPYAIQSKVFNCQELLKSLEGVKSYHMSWLWHTFRDVSEPGYQVQNDCVYHILKDPRLISFELHLINEVCHRNGNCGSYEFLKNISVSEYDRQLRENNPAIIGRLRSYAQQAANFLYLSVAPQAKCYISLGLESNLSKQGMGNGINAIRNIFPGCEFVAHGHRIEATLIERHHNNPGLNAPCIVNLDGVSIKYPGIPNTYPRNITPQEVNTYLDTYGFCDVMYLWHHDYNCYTIPFTDPRARGCSHTNTFAPTAQFIKDRQ